MTAGRARLAIAGVFLLGFVAGAATLLVVRARIEVMSLSADLLPRLLAVFDRSQARIREVLTPAQQQKFDRLVAERRRLLTRARPTPSP